MKRKNKYKKKKLLMHVAHDGEKTHNLIHFNLIGGEKVVLTSH
jgi:hypothetical protein